MKARQIGVCRDATVGAAISRPLLFRQRKCFRLSETLRNLNVFGRLIAAPTVAMQRVCRAVAPVGSGQLSFERKDRPEGYLQPVFFARRKLVFSLTPEPLRFLWKYGPDCRTFPYGRRSCTHTVHQLSGRTPRRGILHELRCPCSRGSSPLAPRGESLERHTGLSAF